MTTDTTTITTSGATGTAVAHEAGGPTPHDPTHDQPRVSRRGERPWFPLMGARAAALVTGADTAGAWEVMELAVTPGGRSPLHTIARDKVFYLSSGQLSVVTDERRHELEPGDCVVVPAGTPHCYRNDGTGTATVVVMATGTGHVDFLQGMSRLTVAGPPDPEALREHTARFGVRILPAPPR